jgi:hypothetical protein
MLKLKNRNRNRNRNRAKATRRAAVAAPRLSEQTARELLIADSAPLQMTRAAAEYVRRAQPGDAWDVRDRLRSVGREEMCRGCFRPTFFLTGEERVGWLCAQCLQQRPSFAPSTLGLAELHVIDVALGARVQGTADALMAEILDCRPVLCTECGSRFYVFTDQPGPHTCAECIRWQTKTAEQAEMDRQQAELGRVRTACRWCDGEFYVPEDEPGPHSCQQCSYKDGF